jgi:chorismate mutase/prephenate dehydratase
MAATAPSLDDLRAEIDRVDASIHDLLMRRVEIVRILGGVKEAGSPKWRPGREAQVLRRLAARHSGEMPIGVLARIWREMIVGGSLALQEAVSVAVLSGNPDSCCWDLARDHFGSVVPMQVHPTSSNIVREVAEGKATIGVLPMPADGAADTWWRALVTTDKAAPRIVARLPFVSAGNGRATSAEALAIARIPFEPSGSDGTIIVFSAESGLSRTSLAAVLEKTGLQGRALDFRETAGEAQHLVDVEGFVQPDDPRLAEVEADSRLTHITILGGYARPLAAG